MSTHAPTHPLTPDATRRSLQLANGERISYHEAGDGPDVLVLLHGSGPGVSAWSNFGANLPVLSQQFRTVMPDLPGFGQSDLPTLDDVYSRIAAHRIIELASGLGLARVHLLGNSMGGNIAAEIALAAPELVGRMVLMGPGGLAVNLFLPSESEGARRLFEFLDAPSREAMVAWLRTMVHDHQMITDEMVDERMANAAAPGAIEAAKAIFATFFEPRTPQHHVPLWQRAAQITTPTLITWGRDDLMLPYESAHFAFRQLPDAELHAFARCGHWAQVERKDDFERLVLDFLTRP